MTFGKAPGDLQVVLAGTFGSPSCQRANTDDRFIDLPTSSPALPAAEGTAAEGSDGRVAVSALPRVQSRTKVLSRENVTSSVRFYSLTVYWSEKEPNLDQGTSLLLQGGTRGPVELVPQCS